ncbi:MAG: metallophosphoesterase family protein [Planctomycetota bacterium]|jgi:putative phosphoesterase
MARVALLSDTHGLLRPEVVTGIAGVERILHMGDVGQPRILDELKAVAPVTVVRGNVDFGPLGSLPETAVVDLFGATGYLIHNLGELDLDPKAAGFQFVFYGHSHEPAEETRDGVRFVNPGSIGPRRFSLPVSYALLSDDLSVEFVTLQ